MMRNMLVLLNQLSQKDLSQALILIDLHQDEVTDWQSLLKLMPKSICDILLNLRDNESYLMKQLLTHSKKNQFVGMDDILACLIKEMPNDMQLINYDSHAKLAYLTELLVNAWGPNDNIRKEIIAPLEKMTNLLLVKREEMDQTARERALIEDCTKDQIKKLKGVSYQALQKRQDEITQALFQLDIKIKHVTNSDFSQLHQWHQEYQRLLIEKIELQQQLTQLDQKISQRPAYQDIQAEKIKKLAVLDAVQARHATQLAASIQNTSADLLKDMRNKLLHTIQQYKDELETSLIHYIEEKNLEAAKRAMLVSPRFTSRRILLGKRGVEYLAKPDHELCQYFMHYLTTPQSKKTLADYRLIMQFQAAVTQPIKDTQQGLQEMQNFKSLFDTHLKPLQHQSRGMQFVKIILSILTFGLANELIWRKTAKESFTDKLKVNLFCDPPSPEPRLQPTGCFACFKP